MRADDNDIKRRDQVIGEFKHELSARSREMCSIERVSENDEYPLRSSTTECDRSGSGNFGAASQVAKGCPAANVRDKVYVVGQFAIYYW